MNLQVTDQQKKTKKAKNQINFCDWRNEKKEGKKQHTVHFRSILLTRKRKKQQQREFLPCSVPDGLTDWDMMRSMTIWEVSEEAKEKGFKETAAAASSVSPATSSGIATPPALGALGGAGERALETSWEDTLQERERNSIGSRGVSGGRNMAQCSGSGRQGSVWPLSIRVCLFETRSRERERRWKSRKLEERERIGAQWGCGVRAL